MKIITAREVERILKANGWRFTACSGSHRQYHKEGVASIATVPYHRGGGDLSRNVIKSLERQTGLSLG
jgi:predicted RNA binding protein YcfA (HicA-like mRNA interferase family)